jgi:hypothetical protein
MLATIGFSVSVLGIGCADKKKSKSSEEQGANQDALYSATLVLPLNATAGTELTLTNEDISTAEITTYDKDGQELGTSSAAVNTDAEGVSTVDIMVDPTKITAVEVPGKDLGVVLQSTGVKPSEPIQRPMTPSGKNVVAAIKSIPADQRPFVDPEVIGTLLPPETKFDPSTMKDMVVAFTEKSRELPKEKREELFLKRLEQKTDYKEIVKAKGSLENAQAAEAVVARKAFIEKNPELAQKSIVKFLEKPSDSIEQDQTFANKIPDAIRERVSGEALARQILAKQVSSTNRALKTDELIEMTDALADVKAAVFVARRGDNVGSKENMAIVIDTIAKRSALAEKPEDIKSDVFLVVVSKVPELGTIFETKRAEVAGAMCTQVVVTLVNDKNPSECREARDGCEALKLRKNGWRDRLSKNDCFKVPNGDDSSNGDGSAVSAQCIKILTKMFQPRTAECLLATNSCMSEKLTLFGWRKSAEGDNCKDQGNNPRICLEVEKTLLIEPATSRCKMIGNSCEKEDLEKSGWTNLNADDVDSCAENDQTEISGSAGSSPGDLPCLILNAPMINPQTNHCVGARTTCDERDLASKGFRRSLTVTQCPPPAQGGSESIVCLQKMTEMFNPVTMDCREAKNSCERVNLEKSGWRPRAEGDKCAALLDAADFANRCGLTLEQAQDSSSVLYNQSFTSLPISMTGTQGGISYNVTMQGSINMAASVASGSFTNNFAVLSSSALASSGLVGLFGGLLNSLIGGQAQSSATDMGFLVTTSPLTKHELMDAMRVNGQLQNMACASRIIKNQTVTRGQQSELIEFAPGLVSAFNPIATVAQLRKEIGQNREIDVRATIRRMEMEPLEIEGKTITREIPAVFECGDMEKFADIAYEIEHIFPGGADKPGLFRSQKVYIDATNKKVVAMIIQGDGINALTHQPSPPVCYVSDLGASMLGGTPLLGGTP